MMPDMSAASLGELAALDDLVITNPLDRLLAEPGALRWQIYARPAVLFGPAALFEDGFSENTSDLIETPNE